MGTRTIVIIIALVAAAYAGHERDLAAIYVALAWGTLTILLHAVEFKLNRLLDSKGISISDFEISKD